MGGRNSIGRFWQNRKNEDFNIVFIVPHRYSIPLQRDTFWCLHTVKNEAKATEIPSRPLFLWGSQLFLLK